MLHLPLLVQWDARCSRLVPQSLSTIPRRWPCPIWVPQTAHPSSRYVLSEPLQQPDFLTTPSFKRTPRILPFVSANPCFDKTTSSVGLWSLRQLHVVFDHQDYQPSRRMQLSKASLTDEQEGSTCLFFHSAKIALRYYVTHEMMKEVIEVMCKSCSWVEPWWRYKVLTVVVTAEGLCNYSWCKCKQMYRARPDLMQTPT